MEYLPWAGLYAGTILLTLQAAQWSDNDYYHPILEMEKTEA